MIKTSTLYRKILSTSLFSTVLFFSRSQFYAQSELLTSKITSNDQVIAKMLSSANEIEDYENLCNDLDKGKLEAASEKISDFKKKYLFSTYENRFVAIQSYLEYKDVDQKIAEDDEDDLSNSNEEAFSPLSAHPEITAYCIYLSGLKQKEGTQLSFFEKNITSLTESSLHPVENFKAFKTFKEFLYTYPKHEFAYDAEQQEKMLYQRLANMRLLQTCILFEKKAYVGAINFGLVTIKQHPQSYAAIQTLFILSLAYDKLHFYELSKEMLKFYQLNRNKIKHLTPETSIVPWFKLIAQLPQAQSNEIEDAMLPLQVRLQNLEQRAKNLEKKAISLVQQQKHTVESALESQKKLGIIHELEKLNGLINQWLEFQLKDTYLQVSSENIDDLKNLFASLFQDLPLHLDDFEKHLDAEEKRFDDQEKKLTQVSPNSISLPFFDSAIEKDVEKQLNRIAALDEQLEKSLMLVG